jgi:2-oxoglutarate ferredoxin oxidoreductase subunit beta
MHPIAEKYLRKSALPTIFCPGCGHGTVLNAFLRAIDEMQIIDNLSLVGGIGCSSWTPVFVNTDVMHTLHGRAIAVATGIGGNHFIHAARRNIDLTVIMLDNHIYGMTGGQVAPTTPLHATTQTSPHGNPEPPINACEVAISCGASYVGRWTTAHPKQTRKAIKQAINHKGFSFLHILSQCPTQAGRYIYDTSKSEEMLQQLKKQSITTQKAAKLSEEELADRTVVGLLYETTDRPELCESIYALMQQGKG